MLMSIRWLYLPATNSASGEMVTWTAADAKEARKGSRGNTAVYFILSMRVLASGFMLYCSRRWASRGLLFDSCVFCRYAWYRPAVLFREVMAAGGCFIPNIRSSAPSLGSFARSDAARSDAAMKGGPTSLCPPCHSFHSLPDLSTYLRSFQCQGTGAERSRVCSVQSSLPVVLASDTR